MKDFGLQFQKDAFDKIEKFYNHLTESERTKLMYLRNKADNNTKLDHHDYNELKLLADSMDVKYERI